jgi:hypothetical protein
MQERVDVSTQKQLDEALRQGKLPILAQAMELTHAAKPWAVVKVTAYGTEHCYGADSREEAEAKRRADGGKGLVVISMA